MKMRPLRRPAQGTSDTPTSLLHLPLELVRQCCENAILVLPFKDSLRLRLVCKLFSEEIPPMIQHNRLLEKEPLLLRRQPLESRNRKHQNQFFASYLSARVKADQYRPNRGKFVDYVLDVLTEMQRVSSPVTIEDVCLCAAVHGPARPIFASLRPDCARADCIEICQQHMLAAATYFGHESLVEENLSKWAGPLHCPTIFGKPLEIAAAKGHTRIMFMLLNDDKDIRRSRSAKYQNDKWAKRKMARQRGWKCYHQVTRAAAAAGKIELLSQYLGPWTSDKFEGSSYGYTVPDGWYDLLTLITLAAANGHTECVAFLMQDRHREAATSKRYLHKSAILQIAAGNGHEELVRWCLSNSTTEELEQQYTSQPKSAYAAAASGGYVDIMRMLPIDWNWADYHLEGAMSRAAHFGSIVAAQHVLDEGFDLNANNLVWRPVPRCPHHLNARWAGKWVTPLLAAIANDQVAMVEFLLDNGLDLDSNPGLRAAALVMAGERGNGGIIGVLKAHIEFPRRRKYVPGAIATWTKLVVVGRPFDLRGWLRTWPPRS